VNKNENIQNIMRSRMECCNKFIKPGSQSLKGRLSGYPLLKSYLALAPVALVVNACEKEPPEIKADGPNILFIYTDDQSQRTLSCYNDENAWSWVQTPNIDRLAAEGVRFTNAYGASWSAPSRACLLSGLMQHAIPGMKLYQNRDLSRPWACIGDGYDPEVTPFWPVDLRKAGYYTAMIGKWHIGQNAGHGRLWDHSIVWDQNNPTGDWYNNQELAIDGAPPKVIAGYSTDVYTYYATQFIKREHKKPWFLWLNYNAPHLPNTVHPRHASYYAGADMDLPTDIFGPRPDKPKYMVDWTMLTKATDGTVYYKNTTLKETIRAYNRLVSAVDEGVGEILRVLEETGQLDSTLIIFTSDQGFAWGEHGYAWKTGPYDACQRMPLIFRMPGKVASGAVCQQPVTIVDISSTIVSFAEVTLPWDMHGHDLSLLLSNPTNISDWPILMEHFGGRFGTETNYPVIYNPDGVPHWLFLRKGKYKYIRTLEYDEIEEIYDLENDPEELINLALNPEYEQLLQEFRSLLLSELERTEAGFINSLPAPATR